MKAFLSALAALLAFSVSAQAGPLEKDRVSANARWVVHIDVDAFRAADSARKIADGWLGRDPARRHLAWLREQIGLDPLQDLRSITFYGTHVELGRGVVVIRAAIDRKRLVDYLKKQPGYQTASHGAHPLHVFQAPGDERRQHNVVGCLQAPSVIVFGRDIGDVTAALDVLDGKSPALAADSRLAKDIPSGTILWLAATDPAGAEMPFKSPFVKLSKQLLLALGEHDREVFLDVKLTTRSKEDAARVRQTIDSFRAFAKQQSGGGEDVERLFQTLEVSTTGQTVGVRWRASGEDVAKLIQSGRKRTEGHADRRSRQEEQKKRFLEKYDKNRNGKLDDNEREIIHAEWTRAMKERRAEHHKRLLDKYDTNKDGKLDDDEKNAIRAEWSRRMEELRKRKKDR